MSAPAVDTTLVLVAVIVGASAIVLAAIVATRRGAPGPATPRGTALAPLVPWLGTATTLVLLGRGATAAAVVVALATLVHAGVTRARAVSPGRRRTR